MFAYIKGELAVKEPGRAVVEAAGLGYEIAISLNTFDKLPCQGAETKLLLWHSVREDDESLFGFATEQEREMFLKLVSVGGVGPKMAMAILSGSSVGELALAISSGNAKRISSIKGVGRKTAEKICVELKDKVDAIGALAAASRRGGGKGDEMAPAIRDAILALAALGFAEETANKMVSAVLEEQPDAPDVETIVRKALAKR